MVTGTFVQSEVHDPLEVALALGTPEPETCLVSGHVYEKYSFLGSKLPNVAQAVTES